MREKIGEGREKGKAGGVSGGATVAREDTVGGGSWLAPTTPKMGFFRCPYYRKLIFFMGK
jgi:hypothetical protein